MSDKDNEPQIEGEETVEKETPDKMYCDSCGAEIDSSAVYCPRCGNTIDDPRTGGYVELASWTQRFTAWIIDTIIIGFVFATVTLPSFQGFRGMGMHLGANQLLWLIYFSLMDHYYGQSIGKKIMKIRVTKVGGAPLSLMDAAVESFGKVFLLPLDFLIGYFLYLDKNQRLFNYLSDTVVIRE